MSLILRTESHRFSSIKNFNFQPNYMDIIDSELGTMRIHFLDEGKKENLLQEGFVFPDRSWSPRHPLDRSGQLPGRSCLPDVDLCASRNVSGPDASIFRNFH